MNVGQHIDYELYYPHIIDCIFQYRAWARPQSVNQTSVALKAGIQIIDYYEDYFGIEFPLPKQGKEASFPSIYKIKIVLISRRFKPFYCYISLLNVLQETTSKRSSFDLNLLCRSPVSFSG